MKDTKQRPYLFSWHAAFMSKHGAGNSTTRVVLSALMKYMSISGDSCFPSIDTLVDDTGLSRQAVVTHLKVASDEGWISKRQLGVSGRGWKRNEYRALIPDSYVEAMKRESAERSAEKEVNGVDDAVNAVDDAVNAVDEAVNDVCEAVNVVDSNNPLNNPKKNTKDVVVTRARARDHKHSQNRPPRNSNDDGADLSFIPEKDRQHLPAIRETIRLLDGDRSLEVLKARTYGRGLGMAPAQHRALKAIVDELGWYPAVAACTIGAMIGVPIAKLRTVADQWAPKTLTADHDFWASRTV